MNNCCVCWFFTHILLVILIFKGLNARRLYKSFGVKGLKTGLLDEKSANNHLRYGTATHNKTGNACTYNIILQRVRVTISFCKGDIIVII
jgi:hypothetical protein